VQRYKKYLYMQIFHFHIFINNKKEALLFIIKIKYLRLQSIYIITNIFAFIIYI